MARVVTHEEFVTQYMEIFNQGGSLNDIAKDLDMKKTAVQARAALLRKAKVTLPKFKREKLTLDANVLQTIVKKMTKDG